MSMFTLDAPSATLAWPLALVLAWLAGELAQRWLHLPRVTAYGLVGFALAANQGGWLADPAGGSLLLLANVALALVLFELGCRINLRWLLHNRWIGVTSVLESAGCFGAVLLVGMSLGLTLVPALLLAAVAMSSSPVAILRVVNDDRSAGQVTERALHLSAFNCIFAAVALKVIVAYWQLTVSGSWLHALWTGFVAVVLSLALGVLSGLALPAILRRVQAAEGNVTVIFALAVLLLTAATHELRLSPLLAALVFGLTVRHRRLVLAPAQRNFGVLGEALTVFLFVFVGATVQWSQVTASAPLALAFIGARAAVKLGVNLLCARPGGITLRKGLLTGLALTPISAFAVMLLEQTRHVAQGFLDQIAGAAAIILILEVVGPLLTHLALVWAGEARRRGKE